MTNEFEFDARLDTGLDAPAEETTRTVRGYGRPREAYLLNRSSSPIDQGQPLPIIEPQTPGESMVAAGKRFLTRYPAVEKNLRNLGYGAATAAGLWVAGQMYYDNPAMTDLIVPAAALAGGALVAGRNNPRVRDALWKTGAAVGTYYSLKVAGQTYYSDSPGGMVMDHVVVPVVAATVASIVGNELMNDPKKPANDATRFVAVSLPPFLACYGMAGDVTDLIGAGLRTVAESGATVVDTGKSAYNWGVDAWNSLTGSNAERAATGTSAAPVNDAIDSGLACVRTVGALIGTHYAKMLSAPLRGERRRRLF